MEEVEETSRAVEDVQARPLSLAEAWERGKTKCIKLEEEKKKDALKENADLTKRLTVAEKEVDLLRATSAEVQVEHEAAERKSIRLE
jgi:hypothetical protein